jgi:hypothetical protein
MRLVFPALPSWPLDPRSPTASVGYIGNKDLLRFGEFRALLTPKLTHRYTKTAYQAFE